MCHSDNCKPCNIIISNDRMFCACRMTIIDPPIKCGTNIPICLNKCNKVQDCGHNCNKYCHFGDCVNCNALTQVYCKCGNTQMLASCSEKFEKNRCKMVCNNFNLCGHNCKIVCHNHDQDSENFICDNKCFKYKTESCNHLCSRTCHYGVEC